LLIEPIKNMDITSYSNEICFRMFHANVRINKRCVSRKLIVIHISGLCQRKGKLWKFFFRPGLRACTSWWPLVSSVTMSTPQEQVQCVLWLAEMQSLTAVQLCFRTQYGCQPPTQKSIRLWDNKLRTAGSLLCVKSSERHRPMEKILWLNIHTWTCWSCICCPNYLLKLSSNKVGRCHISATMLGITWTEIWLGDGSAQVDHRLAS
jgi:hypothetical protein